MNCPILYNPNTTKEQAIEFLKENLTSGMGRHLVMRLDFELIPVVIGQNISPDWLEIFNNKELNINLLLFVVYYQSYVNQYVVLPMMDDIFNVFSMPIRNIKCVILGQDPYKTVEGSVPTAIGYSFASRSKKIPMSLNNMYREIERSFNRQVEDPKSALLSGWIDQGVFLLNTCLFYYKGCQDEKEQPLNQKTWTGFNEKILTIIQEKNKDVAFLLLGNYAQRFLNNGIIKKADKCVLAGHPSGLASDAKEPFMGSNCFLKINELLTKTNNSSIDWCKNI